MNQFKILKIENVNSGGEYWIAVQLKDIKKNHIFWIDCGLMDGYGNKCNFKTNDLFIDWSFNQYIFNLDNETDLQSKEYQEDPDNLDNITDFIDEKNEYLVNILKEGMMK